MRGGDFFHNLLCAWKHQSVWFKYVIILYVSYVSYKTEITFIKKLGSTHNLENISN